MIDLDILRAAAADKEGRPVELTGSCVAQIVAEIEAGRKAQAELGRTFGRPCGGRHG